MKEVYNKMKDKLDKEMQELIVPEASEEDVERQKEMNKELDTTLDTQKQISDLQKEASDEDVERQEKMKDAVDATTDSIEKATDASEKSDVAEKIAHKVRERLNKESLEEGKKESTADIKQRIKDLVQKLKDQNDHLYPEGAKDLAIDMIKKMDIKEEATDLKVGDRVIYDKTGEEFEVIEVNTDRLVTGRDRQGEQKILTTRHISKIDEIKEALESMGTADEDTMKYLLQDIGREELVNFEKQFVVMFDLLTDIRYDGSEQLSKGASEISQRIHNFITIFRQALKGNPVIKEAISSDTRKYMLDKKLDYDKVKAIEKQFTEVARVLKDLEKNGGDPLSPKSTKAYNALVSVSYIFRQMLRDIDDDRISKEFETGTYESKSLTNNHSNPVLEAAKKKLVDRINSIALKEGISKKEATIMAIKALQESK